jgi:hypothetical protein
MENGGTTDNAQTIAAYWLFSFGQISAVMQKHEKHDCG